MRLGKYISDLRSPNLVAAGVPWADHGGRGMFSLPHTSLGCAKLEDSFPWGFSYVLGAVLRVSLILST